MRLGRSVGTSSCGSSFSWCLFGFRANKARPALHRMLPRGKASRKRTYQGQDVPGSVAFPRDLVMLQLVPRVRPGFLGLGAIGVLGWMILGCGGCAVRCRPPPPRCCCQAPSSCDIETAYRHRQANPRDQHRTIMVLDTASEAGTLFTLAVRKLGVKCVSSL